MLIVMIAAVYAATAHWLLIVVGVLHGVQSSVTLHSFSITSSGK